MLVVGVIDRTHRNHGPLCKSKSNLCIGCLRQRVTGQVNPAASRRDPSGTVVEFRRIIPVFPGTNAHFAEIIHTRPDKVTDQSGLLLRHLPESIRIRAEGFASKDQSFRILFQIMLIPEYPVVVSGDIHIGKGAPGFDVAAMKRSAGLHEVVAHQSRQIVEKLASHCFFLLFRFTGLPAFFCLNRFFFRLFVAVDAESNRGKEIKENVDAAGHGPGGVQLMQIIRQFFGQRDPLLLGSFADLVSGGIQDHRRMIVVFLNHV